MIYICDRCGWKYDESVGNPTMNIQPGTRFQNLPKDFVCPVCAVGKERFEPVK